MFQMRTPSTVFQAHCTIVPLKVGNCFNGIVMAALLHFHDWKCSEEPSKQYLKLFLNKKMIQ